MGPGAEALLGIAHRALNEAPVDGLGAGTGSGPRHAELLELLAARNGFFVYGPSLHVFPAGACPASVGLDEWNAPELWKQAYAGGRHIGLCFAEDLFGNQFVIRDDEVHRFDVETGELAVMAPTLDAWAQMVVDDEGEVTGWGVARAWSERHGPIPVGKRINAATPIILGGGYDLDNLRPIDAVELMRWHGDLARQMAGLPDGAKISLTVLE